MSQEHLPTATATHPPISTLPENQRVKPKNEQVLHHIIGLQNLVTDSSIHPQYDIAWTCSTCGTYDLCGIRACTFFHRKLNGATPFFLFYLFRNPTLLVYCQSKHTLAYQWGIHIIKFWLFIQHLNAGAKTKCGLQWWTRIWSTASYIEILLRNGIFFFINWKFVCVSLCIQHTS